jgi:hypothetical protein
MQITAVKSARTGKSRTKAVHVTSRGLPRNLGMMDREVTCDEIRKRGTQARWSQARQVFQKPSMGATVAVQVSSSGHDSEKER